MNSIEIRNELKNRLQNKPDAEQEIQLKKDIRKLDKLISGLCRLQYILDQTERTQP